MAKTVEEKITAAEEKATKAELKRVVGVIKDEAASAVEATEDKGAKKAIKEFSKNLIATLKA